MVGGGDQARVLRERARPIARLRRRPPIPTGCELRLGDAEVDPPALGIDHDLVSPRPLTATAVRQIVARACTRAGLPRLGAHRLRHTLASDLLRAGNSLPQIGQVLRHRSQLSTAIYAKVDTARLRGVARPWPGRG